MRLQLADNGTSQGVTIYHAQTGQPMLLASKATRKAKKESKKKVKIARIEAKTNKKVARADNRTARKVNRQVSKTQRQATKQLKKQTRKEVGAERQNKRKLRVVGRQEIIKARQQSKIDKFTSASQNPEFDPSQDQIPQEIYNDTEGGEYMVSQEDYNQDEETPEDYYDEYEEEELQDGLSFGIPSLITGALNLINKASNSGAGQAVRKVAASSQELQRLRLENKDLQNKVSSLNTKLWVVAGASVGGGLLLGYAVKSAMKR